VDAEGQLCRFVDKVRVMEPEPESSKFILAIFCSLCVLIYVDRGAISSNGINGDGVQKAFGLNLVQDGLLPAAFMVGLLVSSPIFAALSKRESISSMKLIGYGLSVWSISMLLCGLSFGFWSLILCRMAVGVGEASFVALASPFIDDYAPMGQKTRWLAIFYASIPVGYALGFLYGGTVAVYVGWRMAFMLQALMMVPFIIYSFRSTVRLKSHHGRPLEYNQQEDTSLLHTIYTTCHDVWTLFTKYSVFVLTTLGMTCYTAVIGSYAFYGPQASKNVFNVSSETTDISFSVMTVLTGILGTFLGGHVLDVIGSSLRNGMLLGATGMFGGAAFIITAFIASSSFATFCIIFSLGEFFLFFAQAPSNALILWSVPPNQRAMAISISVVCMHIFGDVPAPPLIGLLESRIHNWRITMVLAAILIIIGGFVYTLGIIVSPSATDFRDPDRNVHDNNVTEQDEEQQAILSVVHAEMNE
jgi:MFS family permease